MRVFSAIACSLAVLACASRGSAQLSSYPQFRAHNASMGAVQPDWMGPLIQADARLGQAERFSVSNSYCPGARVLSWGNNKGVSIIAARRFQLEVDPPSYVQNHSATLKDGFANTHAQIKWRVASGNAEHRNYIVSALLTRGFTPGSYENGMYTGDYHPTVAGGRVFGRNSRYSLQGSLGAVLPTGKIDLQGRTIEWNMTAQMHPSGTFFVEVENNASFNKAGPYDGTTQNFVTPAAFYVLHRRGWEPAHGTLVFDAGMQIATTQFHLYNHNLVSEVRIVF